MKKKLIILFIYLATFFVSTTGAMALEGECVTKVVDGVKAIVISADGKTGDAEIDQKVGSNIPAPFTYADGYEETEDRDAGFTFAIHCNNQPDEYKLKIYRTSLCSSDPYKGAADPDFTSCVDIFNNSSGQEVVIKPGEDADLLAGGSLVLPIGSYPFLAIIVNNHIKIKHVQKYIHSDDSRGVMYGNGDAQDATNTNTDECYTLDKVTTYTNLIADNSSDDYDEDYNGQHGVTLVRSGTGPDASLLKCVSDGSRTNHDFATEIIDHFGDDKDLVAHIDYEAQDHTGVIGLKMAATMLKSDNTSIADDPVNAKRISAFFQYAAPVDISENTVGFKLNFAATTSVSVDGNQNTKAEGARIWASKVGADPFTVEVQTKTRRLRGAWR